MSPSALLEIEEKAHDLVPIQAVLELVDEIYTIDVRQENWPDSSLGDLQRIIDRLISLLNAAPLTEARPLIERLWTAREAVEQGLSPDPAKRPTLAEMRAHVAAHLD